MPHSRKLRVIFLRPLMCGVGLDASRIGDATVKSFCCACEPAWVVSCRFLLTCRAAVFGSTLSAGSTWVEAGYLPGLPPVGWRRGQERGDAGPVMRASLQILQAAWRLGPARLSRPAVRLPPDSDRLVGVGRTRQPTYLYCWSGSTRRPSFSRRSLAATRMGHQPATGSPWSQRDHEPGRTGGTMARGLSQPGAVFVPASPRAGGVRAVLAWRPRRTRPGLVV